MPQDFDAIAQKYGGSAAPPGTDLDALAQKYGGSSSAQEDDTPPPSKTFNQQLTEERPLAPYDPQHPIKSVAHDIGTELGNVGAGGISSIESMAHPIDTAKKMFSGLPSALKSVSDPNAPAIDPGYAIGTAIPFLGAGEAISRAPQIADAASHPMDTFRAGKNAAASVLREPATAAQSRAINPRTGMGQPGAVKPILPAGLQKWTVPDWAIPKGELGTPTNPGMFNDIPTKLTRAQIEAPKVIPAAREEMYNDLASRRVQRGAEQAKIDAANAKRLSEAEDARQKELADAERLKTQHANALSSREEEPLQMPSIVQPSAMSGEPRATGSEGRPATWSNEAVLDLAKKGNRDAIAQAVVRKLPMPPNTRYIMGDPDYPRAIYNPRETTVFGPDSMPIRNKAGLPVSQKATIARPNPESVSRQIPIEPEERPLEATGNVSAPNPNISRSKLAELDDRYNKLDAQLRNSRSYASTKKLIAKIRPISEQRDALRGSIAPEAEGPEETPTPKLVAKPKATGPKQSRTPTYDSLSPEMKEQVDDAVKQHPHLPQIMRESNEREMRKVTGPTKGDPMKEQYARWFAKQAGGEVKKNAPSVDALSFLRAMK